MKFHDLLSLILNSEEATAYTNLMCGSGLTGGVHGNTVRVTFRGHANVQCVTSGGHVDVQGVTGCGQGVLTLTSGGNVRGV